MYIDDHNVEEFIQIVGEAVLMDSKEERKKAGNILKKYIVILCSGCIQMMFYSINCVHIG